MPLALLAIGGLIGIGYMLLKAGEGINVNQAADNSAGDNQQPSAGDSSLDAKVQEFAQAIAHAEGFYDPSGNTVPQRAHNPGDLGLGNVGFGTVAAVGSMVTIFPDDAAGWSHLYSQVRGMLTGTSHVYNPKMTITEVARKYAGDWQNWANNVSAQLGVPPDTTLADWLAS